MIGEMATTNNEEDFITCGVCLCEYDEQFRKPKFLPCSHTFCLPCLQDLRRDDTITCPVCRKIISKDSGKEDKWILPNNTYALQMLRRNGRGPGPSSSLEFPLLRSVNLNALLELKEELLKIRDTGMDKLALAIQKRKEVQKQMAHVIEAIHVAAEEAHKFQEGNDVSLAEMVTVLEKIRSASTNPATVSQNVQRRDLVVSEMMSLVEGSTSSDSVDTLKQKMKKSAEIYKQKLDEATAVASEYELRQKTKVQVFLSDENDRPIPTCSWLEEGYFYQPGLGRSLDGLKHDNLLLLTHHFLFTLVQRLKIPLKNVQQSTSDVSNVSMDKKQPKTSEFLTSTPPLASSSDSFYLSRSRKFSLKFYQSGSLIGEIHIRPAPTFHPQFVKELADFCYKSPKNVSNTIRKAMPGVFILLPMSHPQFQPIVRSMIKHGSTYHNCTVEDFDEFGITLVKNSAKGKIIGWSFVFVLEEYEHFQERADHLPKPVRDNEYFGDVIYHQGLIAAVIQLSKVNELLLVYPEWNFVIPLCIREQV